MAVDYLVDPGPVRSRTDGDVHEVSVSALVKLYGLRADQYVVWDSRKSYESQKWKLELVRLRPRADGNYTLPDPKPRPTVWPFPTVHGNMPD